MVLKKSNLSISLQGSRPMTKKKKEVAVKATKAVKKNLAVSLVADHG
jgi:hypothetical protein